MPGCNSHLWTPIKSEKTTSLFHLHFLIDYSPFSHQVMDDTLFGSSKYSTLTLSQKQTNFPAFSKTCFSPLNWYFHPFHQHEELLWPTSSESMFAVICLEGNQIVCHPWLSRINLDFFFFAQSGMFQIIGDVFLFLVIWSYFHLIISIWSGK